MTVVISRFTSRHDVSPVREERAWPDFAALFSAPFTSPCTWANCLQSACPHKQGPCWSPAVFAEDRRHVSGVSLLVFDVDRATDDQIFEIRSRITSLRHLVHSTHSDRPGLRCVRIVIPLSRQVPREAWGTFWHIAHQAIASIADLSCADAGRIYFFPSCPRDVHYFLQVNEGAVLDVDAALRRVGMAVVMPAKQSQDEEEGRCD